MEPTDVVFTSGADTVAARVEKTAASAYRLVRRNDELLLQGAYEWQQGSEGGLTWRDIPTEEETAKV